MISARLRRIGDGTAALAAWRSGFAALPLGVTELPSEMAERGAILQRLGRTSEADQLAARLRTIGYRRTG